MKKIYELFKVKDTRLGKYTLVLSVILAIFQVVGHSINEYYDLREIYSSVGDMILSIGKILLYATLMYFTIILITNLIEKQKSKENKEYKFLTANKKSFGIAWIIIFIAWIPYFLQYYPGILSPDSIRQILQGMGELNYTTHHPLLHTLLIKLFIDIGNFFNNIILGISLYTFFQMIIMSSIFAFVVYYISKKRLPNTVRILTLVSFALYPIHAMYGITMWKDILFGGLIVLYTICIYEFITNKSFLENKKTIITFIILTVLVIMLRKNGIFVVLFVAPFLMIIKKEKLKIVCPIILSSFAIYFILQTTLINICQSEKGEIREALAIPIQQLARVVKYEGSNMNEEELMQIKKFIQTDEMPELYNPILADPIKDCFNSQVFNDNKLEFISMWITNFFKYPLQYIESFLCGSYGYWYPNIDYWIVSDWGMAKVFGEIKPVINTNIIPNIVDFFINEKHIPIFFSIGSNVWIMLISFMLCMYQKRYKILIAFIPVIIVVLTSMASPVFGEFRYVYGLFTTMPLLLSITYLTIKKQN